MVESGTTSERARSRFTGKGDRAPRRRTSPVANFNDSEGGGPLDPEEQLLRDRLFDEEDFEDAQDATDGLLPGAARVARLEKLRELVAAAPGNWARADRKSGRRNRYAGRCGIIELTPSQWKVVVSAFGERCAYCNSGGDLTRDHVHPVSLGGDHAIWNIVPACGRCNSSKGASELEEWAERRRLSVSAIYARIDLARTSIVASLGPGCLSPCYLRRAANE